ncbi:transporter substrate-binding domain-containing protein [Vibrio hannami]|uniref:substrate-binding periplasmic protein n=1 Tax=Vibrio hannami TaxID=2717094 RepID=UPI0024107677|nr:transporter substrate-binding domain-containing protein [Vibrio hannami]MDG3085098.1 transporter substrate-binding domain-containing protein [Vibrio hannami]
MTLISIGAVPYGYSKILIVGDSQHPPFSYLENGENKGIYTEIVQQTLSRMSDSSAVIELYPWKRSLSMVERGEAQAIFPPHYFPEMRPYLIDYSAAMMTEYASVFCNADILEEKGVSSDKGSTWPSDYRQLSFALSRGVKMGGDEFWSAVETRTISAEEVNGPENALNMVLTGRKDCHINDKVTVLWYLKNVFSEDKVNNVVLSTVIAEEAGYLAVGSMWEEVERSAFLSEFNHHLNLLINDGTVEEIIHRYIQ